MRIITRNTCVALAIAAAPASAQWQSLGRVDKVTHDDRTVLVQCGPAKVQLTAVADGVVRVRLAQSGEYDRDFSWAVEKLSPGATVQQFTDDASRIEFLAGGNRVVIDREPCRMTIFDRDQNLLIRDEPARGMGWLTTTQPDIAPVRVWQQLPPETAIYGLGEKTGGLNKRPGAWTMWNTDAPYGPSSDPLYQSIPLFIASRDGVYWGVFLDNPWRTSFDFDKEARDTLSFGAEGGQLNYYVIEGPGPKDVLRRYTDLTGRTPLPPKWAIGYQQCRYSYYPEARVRKIASTFREKRIPCDVIYFDIDYMNGYRCFTWNQKWFPNPKKMIDDLHADGFHTVTIVDPGIKFDPGYFAYDEGSKIPAWLTKPDGQPYVGRVWPGDSVFPDFTNPRVREWWAGLFPSFINESGVDGIWNDMNEPADFATGTHTVPLDIRFNNEGRPASHRADHNVYGMQMHRATRDGLLKARPNQRPFTLTRATYAGGQRFGAAWTGDNYSTWEHLRLSIAMSLGMGVSGFPFVGADIGGFNGGASPELYARWIQVGSLMPYSRTHTSWTSPDQEPWSFGPEVENVARQSINRRYELLPYLYTLFEEATRTGIPIMRPIWMEFPTWHGEGGSTSFLLGKDLLVAPITQPQARDSTAWTPPGVWFDTATDLVYAAGQPVPIPGALDRLPLFVRAGAIIPKQSVVQHTGELPTEPLILDVWPFGESTAELYEDDGATFAYQKGEYRRTKIRSALKENVFELTMLAPEGAYSPPRRIPLVRIHGLDAEIDNARCARADPFPLADMSVNSVDARRIDGVWHIHMLPDDGRPQTLRVLLKPKVGEPKPVQISLDAKSSPLWYAGDMPPPTYDNDGVRLQIKNTWQTYVVLPRIRIPVAHLPRLKLRLTTENTKEIVIRFATDEEPRGSDRESAKLAVTPDGKPHDYEIDMAKVSGGRWTGTLYLLRLDFRDGTMAGESIFLDRVELSP